MKFFGNRNCGVNDGSGVKLIEARDSSFENINLRGMPRSSASQLHAVYSEGGSATMWILVVE